jgi:hypothetical protein
MKTFLPLAAIAAALAYCAWVLATDTAQALGAVAVFGMGLGVVMIVATFGAAMNVELEVMEEEQA